MVVTHDADFGRIAIASGEAILGILYLRSGHIDPTYTIAALRALLTEDPDLRIPFMVVVRRADRQVRIRIRPL